MVASRSCSTSFLSSPPTFVGIVTRTWTWWSPRTPAAAPSFGTLARGYGRLIRSPVFLGFALQGGLSPGSFTAIMAAGPYLMVEVLDRPATEFGIYFALVTIVYMSTNYIGGRFSSRFGIERMVLLAGLISAAAALAGLAWFAVFGLGVAVIFLTSSGTSVGNGLAQPNSQVGAMNVIPELAGTASGGAAFTQLLLLRLLQV